MHACCITIESYFCCSMALSFNLKINKNKNKNKINIDLAMVASQLPEGWFMTSCLIHVYYLYNMHLVCVLYD